MNITEATAVQTLLRFLLDPHADADDQPAREAAQQLANRAHDRLGAGLTPAAVDQLWPDLLTGCAGCPTCDPADHTGWSLLPSESTTQTPDLATAEGDPR